MKIIQDNINRNSEEWKFFGLGYIKWKEKLCSGFNDNTVWKTSNAEESVERCFAE